MLVSLLELEDCCTVNKHGEYLCGQYLTDYHNIARIVGSEAVVF